MSKWKAGRSEGRAGRALLARGALLALLAGALPGAAPQAAWAQAGEPQDDALAQGQHYLERGRRDLALAEFEAARRAPGGEQDHRLLSLLAGLYLEDLRIERAYPTAEAAVRAAASPAQQQQAEEFLRQLRDRYSPVTVRSGSPEVTELRGLSVEDGPGDPGVVGPEKKRVLAALAARLEASPAPLPTTLYLPFGWYLIEGTPLQVKRGEPAEISLLFARETVRPDPARTASGTPDDGRRRLWIGTGIAAGVLLTLSVLLMLL